MKIFDMRENIMPDIPDIPDMAKFPDFPQTSDFPGPLDDWEYKLPKLNIPKDTITEARNSALESSYLSGEDNLYNYGKLYENTIYDIDGDLFETDDNGIIYKKNGELLPNVIFEKNGYTYTTDERGRQVHWEGESKYAPDNERDNQAQSEAGGTDRQEYDDGGHLVARVLGGSEGNENIVAMRDTINRGDYKRSENEIAEAKKSGKEVYDSGKVIYEGDSTRPSKIERTYTIDGKKTELVVDNKVGSKELLDDISDDISVEDQEYLETEFHLLEEDGDIISITSIKREYDADGNLSTVILRFKIESTGERGTAIISDDEN